MMKLFFILSLFFLVSCESKRVLFISEFSNVVYDENLFLEIVKKYNPTIDMDKILKGTSKNCHGIDIENPVFFCEKGKKIAVMSFYKITDRNKSFELDHFYKEKRNKFEEASFKMHEKVSKDISIKLSVQQKNQLMSKQEMKNILETYKD
ncbi:MAG: hypothetical protein ACLGHN_08200 [Bacteriovoracia bacterium]